MRSWGTYNKNFTRSASQERSHGRHRIHTISNRITIEPRNMHGSMEKKKKRGGIIDGAYVVIVHASSESNSEIGRWSGAGDRVSSSSSPSSSRSRPPSLSRS